MLLWRGECILECYFGRGGKLWTVVRCLIYNGVNVKMTGNGDLSGDIAMFVPYYVSLKLRAAFHSI